MMTIQEWVDETGKHDDVRDGYYYSPYLSFGDYDRSCEVERSNVRVFYDKFGMRLGVKWKRGHYGHECIALHVSVDEPEIIHILDALESYPAIDDEDVSKMRQEMIDEHIREVFLDDLLSMEETEVRYMIEKETTEDQRVQAVYDACNDMDVIPEIQAGGNVYISERFISGAFIRNIMFVIAEQNFEKDY